MKSHQCEFNAADLLAAVAPPLLPLLLFAAAMHLGAASGRLPAPRPILDADRTILLHQAEASRQPTPAAVLLLGDSSCLMDVWAPRLQTALDQPVLNLGTLSYLDLPSLALLLEQYTAANPGRTPLVVLLMHPESLRLAGLPAYHAAVLRHYLAGRDAPPTGHLLARFDRILGLDIFRGRLWTRLVPSPLPGEFGRAYGFTWDLWRSLDQHAGSAVDPHRFDPTTARGNAEYRLAARLETESRIFRQRLPPHTRLAVGLTPAPESFVLPDHSATCRQILAQWGAWLEADALLTQLPATRPAAEFASVTHLRATGAQRFSADLASLLRPLLSSVTQPSAPDNTRPAPSGLPLQLLHHAWPQDAPTTGPLP
ncbi:MAG: hypothetical protein FJ387_10960 [Verrucomicrobia bacterium]|nr:hypothetical protein [Verrucomicrobiota bacterium]